MIFIYSDLTEAVSMQRTVVSVALMLSVAAFALGEKKTMSHLIIQAVTHDTRLNTYTSQYTTPARSNTSCGGSGTATPSIVGSDITFTANCQTTSIPAQVHETTTHTVDVTDIVEANGNRYTITCRANWAGSHCAPMVDGQKFAAEFDGYTTMWISGHKNGNQGPAVRVKYRVLDVRPIPVEDKLTSASLANPTTPTVSPTIPTPTQPTAGQVARTRDEIAGPWTVSFSDSVSSGQLAFSLVQDPAAILATFTASMPGGTVRAVVTDSSVKLEINQTAEQCPGRFIGTGELRNGAVVGTFSGYDCQGQHQNGNFIMTQGH